MDEGRTKKNVFLDIKKVIEILNDFLKTNELILFSKINDSELRKIRSLNVDLHKISKKVVDKPDVQTFEEIKDLVYALDDFFRDKNTFLETYYEEEAEKINKWLSALIHLIDEYEEIS